MTAGENRYYGGLLRFDLSEKPAYRKLRELVKKTWHTEEKIETGTDGICRFRGFYGDYRLTLERGGVRREVTASFHKNADGRIAIVLD